MVEADLLLGRFADAYIATLSDRDLADFEALLELPDPDIFDWIAGAGSPPAPYATPLLTTLIAFHAKRP
jgi:antitoxin CptB